MSDDTCTCPENRRTIPKKDRMEVVLPDAITFVNGQKVVDREKILVFDKNCPIHGFREA